MANTGAVNIIGCMFSVYFYTWLHPDMSANVRIGFNQFKVDHAVYFGTVVWLFFGMCIFAPRFTHRTNALVGNVGMALCSIAVIVNHYMLERKWVWGGVMYVLNIFFYALFMGLVMMGQTSKYHYDRSRFYKILIPVGANVIVIGMCYQLIEHTKFDDVMPWTAFGVHTVMAIMAQVAAPRTETFDFFGFLNKDKRN